MAVPGAIKAGLVIHRSVQPGCKRSLAKRKFGAMAFLSCAESPVAWHFKHGAAELVNKSRAISFSAVVIGSIFCGMYGCGWLDMAWKNDTSVRISSSDKKNVGIRTCRYERTPLRFISVVLSDGLARNALSQSGLTRAPSLVRTGGRFCLFSAWYCGKPIRTDFCPIPIWWQPMQLYFVTSHHPFWMAARWSAGLYMYSCGSVGSVDPRRKVVNASISSLVTLGFGMRRRSIGSGLYFPRS